MAEYIEINGKQYLIKTRSLNITNEINEKNISEVKKYLDFLFGQYGEESTISTSVIEHWDSDFIAEIYFNYKEVETDAEYDKRIKFEERVKKEKARAQERKQNKEQNEMKQLERLAKKLGKKII